METQQVGSESWELVRAVRLRGLREAADAFGSTAGEDAARSAKFWQERLADTGAVTFLGLLDGTAVGIVRGAPFDGRGGAAGLFGLWVAPEARGKGFGERLVDAVVSWARSSGYTRLVLEVGDANLPAVRLYERKGFEPTGRRGTLPEPRAHILEHERELML